VAIYPRFREAEAKPSGGKFSLLSREDNHDIPTYRIDIPAWTAAPWNPAKFGVFFYLVEAVGSGKTPVTSSLEHDSAERHLVIVPHEGFPSDELPGWGRRDRWVLRQRTAPSLLRLPA